MIIIYEFICNDLIELYVKEELLHNPCGFMSDIYIYIYMYCPEQYYSNVRLSFFLFSVTHTNSKTLNQEIDGWAVS